MAERRLIVYPDAELMAEATAARTLLTIADTLAAPGHERFDWALTGGTDGNRLLDAIKASSLVDIVDWNRVHIWWGDERFVPADDPDRNAGQAREALLDALVAEEWMPEGNIHEMPADARSADAIAAASVEENAAVLAEAAGEYAGLMRAEMGEQPRFDLAQFGMGPDAHYASLFPGLPQILIDDPAVLVVGVQDSPKLPPLRLTLTAPMIAASRRTWALTTGERKAEAAARALAQRNNPEAPISYADAVEELLWLVDEDAVSRVNR